MLAPIELNRSQQCRKFLRTHTGMVYFLTRLENIPGLDIGGWIPLRVPMRHGIAEYLPRSFERSFSNIQLPTILNSLDHCHNLRSFNLGNSDAANYVEHVRLQAAPSCFNM